MSAIKVIKWSYVIRERVIMKKVCIGRSGND